MDHETLRNFCLSLPHTTEGFPFDQSSLVFKVHGKMFAILSLDAQPPRINLKNEPEVNLALRDEHEGIIPGYHMNKAHWNTVIVDQRLPWPLVQELISTSYNLIWQKLPKKLKQEG